jgi:phosphatidylserine/phosphatidylglycerophosphate/cardiolipin synthase-like enzyme
MKRIWQVGAVAIAAIFVSNLQLPVWAARQPLELTACFMPGEDCSTFIVGQIDAAKTELLVQAYYATSPTILQALGKAKARDVDVKVLLDKRNEQRQYNGVTYLLNHGIAVLIDDQVKIAHNKVIVIDRQHLITGSFNFTQSAQKRNAENVLLIANAPELAQRYAIYWLQRASVARPAIDFRAQPVLDDGRPQ